MIIITIILILMGFGVGIVVGKKMRPSSTKSLSPSAEDTQKILDLAKKNSKITNADVQKLLGVSDATAERYLNHIERASKLRQVGTTGRTTHYTLP